MKLFMGASTGNMLVDRMEVLRKVFANAGMLIATHCEEQAIISANTVAFKENTEKTRTSNIIPKYGVQKPVCILLPWQ